MKTEHFAWVLLLITLTGIADPGPARTRQGQGRSRESPDPCAIRIVLDDGQTQMAIPLLAGGAAVEFRRLGAITLEVKGARGGEPFAFLLQGSTQPTVHVTLGPIFEFLPFGVTTDWQRVTIGMPSPTSPSLSKISHLLINRMEETDAILFVRDVRVIEKAPDLEDWDAMALPTNQLGIRGIDEISLIVLDHYENIGTKVGRIAGTDLRRRETPESLPRKQVPGWNGNMFLVTDFDGGRPNHLKGQFAPFQRPPSLAQLDLDPVVRRGGAGKSLRLDFNQDSRGFCGFWIHLFDSQKAPDERVFLDASPFEYLSFWIKGAKGGEDLAVQLADYEWERREDSVPLAAVSEFLPGGAGNEWREVVIPLRKTALSRLDYTRLASIVLNVRQPGSGTVYIDDISFKTSATASVPETKPSQSRLPDRRFHRATWVWEATRYLENGRAREELFLFSKNRGMDTLFVQIQWVCQKQRGIHTCRVERETQLRAFIREAHAQGIEVHALDGYSYYVLPDWHEKVYAQVRAVLAFNASAEPEERFDGIHHDNEPYVLPAFVFSESLKEQLLVSFLDLTAGCQTLIKQARPSLVYGVDIPFWYSKLGEDFRIVGEITWRGVRKPASFHVIDIVDRVGIMAYRTTPYGADGVVTLVDDEIRYANSRDKQVLVALETHALPEQTSLYFEPMPESTSADHPLNSPRQYLLVEEREGAVLVYGPKVGAEATSLLQGRRPGEAKRRVFHRSKSIEVPSRRLSFAGSNHGALEAMVRRIEDEFREDASFSGVALHHLESLRKLLDQ